MEKIELTISRVFERDVDLYVINKFMNDIKFKNLFLEKIDKEEYEIVNCIHSYVDNDGESDITIILKKDKHKIALLIEDKIDASAMPNQRKRYDKRGKTGIKQGNYDEYYVFIMAPKDYLENNLEAQKYENKISYEEIINYLNKTDEYGEQLFKKALQEKKKGYVIHEDKKVTKFWEKYYDYVEQNYKQLNIKRYKGPRGTDACWPGFVTPVKYVRIQHKSDRGYVDLEFPGVADYYYEISKILEGKLDEDMTIARTSKSMSIRIKCPVIRFDDKFENYLNEMKISLDAVVRLQNLLSKIEYKKILELANGG